MPRAAHCRGQVVLLLVATVCRVEIVFSSLEAGTHVSEAARFSLEAAHECVSKAARQGKTVAVTVPHEALSGSTKEL